MLLRPARLVRCAALSVLCWLSVAPVWADVYTDVQRLMGRQEWAKAQDMASRHLTNRAQDPQMRLLLSRIQEGMGQNHAAMATLLELTLTFPELAEPHNNLAAQYALAGRYEDALASLNRAILARPDYATALENLGDLHAALAKQAYDRAVKSAPASPRPQSKAQAIGQMLLADPH
jgi:tetratricopeptide (TPR) repeat protein